MSTPVPTDELLRRWLDAELAVDEADRTKPVWTRSRRVADRAWRTYAMRLTMERPKFFDPARLPSQKEGSMAERKRELIDTGHDKRYVRRNDKGQFTTDQVDVGRSSSADQRQHSKASSKAGQGDKGDRTKPKK
jgi:hypothetical protein